MADQFMEASSKEKSRVSLEPIHLSILGGTFVVREVFANGGAEAEHAAQMIRSTPPDRWFVMLAEGKEESGDVLALIDDDFEFQSVAAGSMETD